MMKLMKICILTFGLHLRWKYLGKKCLNLQTRSMSCLESRWLTETLFDEVVLVKKLIFKCCEKDSWQKAFLEQKWVQIFKNFKEKDIEISYFESWLNSYFLYLEHQLPVREFFPSLITYGPITEAKCWCRM